MVEFQRLVGHIQTAYAAIASKIEELVLVLNETESADPETGALASQITQFLKNLERSVNVAERSARREHAASRTIALLDQELNDLKRLETFMALTSRKPTPDLITKVHELSKAISREMDAARRVG